MRKLIAVTLSLLTVAALTACDPGTPEPTLTPSPSVTASAGEPTPTPTASPSPEADPDSTPAFIVVTGASVSVGSQTNRQLLDIPYSTDAATAVAQLTAITGIEPTVTSAGAVGGCGLERLEYDFGGLAIWAPGGITTPAGATFNAVLTAATGAGGLELDTTGFQQVGSTIDSVLGAVPDAVVQDPTGYPYITMGRVNPEAPDYDAIGVLASLEGGVVTRIHAPLYLFGDC